MMKMFCTVFAITALAACSAKSEPTDEPPKVSDPKPAPTITPPKPETPSSDPAAAPSDMPAECMTYKDLAEKLATCDKLGDTRATLKAEFDKSWKAWGAMPVAELETIKRQCKTAADTLKSAVAASCGW